jgi:serine incorporator 1/3
VLRFEFVFLSFHLVYKFKLAGIDSSDTHTKEWYQVQAVLRASLGNCLFFVVLALIMIGVKDQNDRRDTWHHGGWTVKSVIWLLLIVLAFFIPDSIMLAYGMLSSPYFLPLGSL